MARLTESDARRLVATVADAMPERLREADAAPSPAAQPEALERLADQFRNPEVADELGRRLTLDLAAYLNRPVRCSVMVPSAAVADAWRFTALVAGVTWWIDLDVDLGVAFADAMIGGDGGGSLGRGRRVRALAEQVAWRMFQTAASASGMARPIVSSDGTDPKVADGAKAIAIAGGLCAVTTRELAWQIGVVAPAAVPHSVAPSAPVVVHAPRPIPQRPQQRPVETVIEAMRARIAETSHAVVAPNVDVSESQEPPIGAEQPAALGLALTAGGTGAVIALLDRDVVTGLASGASGAPIPVAEPIGDVIVAAAEAVMRDALLHTGRLLPGIASEAQRVIRLSDIPLPARTPHHIVTLHVAAGERSGSIRLLVPSWMLEPTDEAAP